MRAPRVPRSSLLAAALGLVPLLVPLLVPALAEAGAPEPAPNTELPEPVGVSGVVKHTTTHEPLEHVAVAVRLAQAKALPVTSSRCYYTINGCDCGPSWRGRRYTFELGRSLFDDGGRRELEGGPEFSRRLP